MTQLSNAWRVLAIALAVVSIGVGTVVVSQLSNPNWVSQVLAKGDDDGNAHSHEGCYIGPIFDYSASLSELDFGSVVSCTSQSMLFIRTDAYLYRLNNDDEWVHMMTANQTCFVRNT